MSTSQKIVRVCAMLHNMAVTLNDPLPDGVDEDEDPPMPPCISVPANERASHAAGKAYRESLLLRF